MAIVSKRIPAQGYFPEIVNHNILDQIKNLNSNLNF